MRITKCQLRLVIKEELHNFVPQDMYLRNDKHSGHIFERSYVTGVLGIRLPLNESYPYSPGVQRRIIQEQLLMEGFFGDLMAKGKEVADDMIEKGKAKLMSVKAGIAKFGKEAWDILSAFWHVIQGGASQIASFTKRIYRRGIDKLFSQIKEALTWLAEKLPNWGMPTFGGWAEKGMEMLTNFLEKIKGLDGWKKVIGFAGLAVGLHYIWDKVGEWIGELKEKIGGDFQAALGLGEAEGDSNKMDAIREWIKETATEKLKEIGGGGLKKVMEQLASVASGIKPWWDAAVKIAGGVKLVVDALGDAASAFMARQDSLSLQPQSEALVRRYVRNSLLVGSGGSYK